MNIKLFKNIFIILIVILVISGIYIVYFKNSKENIYSTGNIKEIKISKDIIIGITELDTINPILTKNLEIQQITRFVYEPLINITQDFNTEPAIALEWSKLDNLTYIIKLNEQKKWHDGKSVTFEDIKFTIEKIKEEDSIYKENVQVIEKLERIDDFTFKIYLNKETQFFEYLLCFPIIQKETYNADIANGTGKYSITKLSENEIVLNSNEQKITVKILKNATELYNQFTRGEIDLIITQNINYEDYIGSIGFEENIITGREFYYISCNNIKNTETRKYLNDKINKQRIIYNLYNKKYIEADFPLDYGSYLNKEKNNRAEISLNINKTLTLSSDQENINIAKEIKTNLEESGVSINIIEYKTDFTDLTLKVQTVPIIPDLSMYFENEEIKKDIQNISKIENKEILKEEYGKIIDKYYEEMPFICLYFDSYIMLHSEKLKGRFSGNWYNMFNNIETWYKVM